MPRINAYEAQVIAKIDGKIRSLGLSGKETIEKYKNIKIKLGSPGVFDRAAKHVISKKDYEK